MLTIIQNIERFNRRYNRRRGSAMLMVLMTMAIIIVVGTSMLFVTLSSFSNSIADTQQTRAYNAALTVSGNVQQSMEEIILNKGDLITREGTYLYFTSNENFTGEEEIVDYTMVNGAKVQVVLTNIGASDELEDVLVDVIATCRQQTSKISFTYHNETTTRNVTLEDTFGNAFVMNSDTGGEGKRDDLVFRRIEGDISINCWDEILDSEGKPVLDEDGNPKKKMTTRVYNPIVLEGLTGSIYANGDLIIGAFDNVIKVQGNIYCDGNLTIRGLDLGVNLPALYKKEYKKKFIKYSTIGNKTFAGFEILGTGEYKEYIGKGTVNEAMYLKYTTENGDDDFLPLQIYDEVTHYTLHDLGITKFYTMVYVDENGNKINDGNGEVLKGADGNPLAIEIGDKPNPNYYGATMYYTQECKPEDMIMQYPQGGNIYCSGDIIFDRVNYGYNWVFAPKGTGDSTQYEYHDLSLYDGTGKGKISLDGSSKENKAVIDKINAATVALNKSKINGDVFCLGRMIIAPENLLLPDSDKTEAIVFTQMNGSSYNGAVFNGYLDANTINTQVYSDGDTFFERVKLLLGFSGDEWNRKEGNYTYNYGDSYRFKYEVNSAQVLYYYRKHKGSDNRNLNSFLSALETYGEKNIKNLKNALIDVFNNTINDNKTKLYNNNYILKGDGYLTGMGTDEEEGKKLLPIEFGKNVNLYIYNWKYDLLLKTQTVESEEFRVTEITRQLNNSSLVQECRTDGTLKNTSTSTVNGVPYKAALTVKYQTLDVNKVYVNGNIEAVGVDAFGYDVKAGLNAKEIDKIGEFVSNEYQEISILDIIMKINNCNEKKALEKLQEDYWGFKDGDNLYTGYADLTYSIKDDEKGNDSIFLKYTLVALANYKCTYYDYHAGGDRTLSWEYAKDNSVRYLVVPVYLYKFEDGKFYYVNEFNYNDYKQVDEDTIKRECNLTQEQIDRIKQNKIKFSDGLYGTSSTKLNEKASAYIASNQEIPKTRYDSSQYYGDGTFGFNGPDSFHSLLNKIRLLAFKVDTYCINDYLDDDTSLLNKDEYNKVQAEITYYDVKNTIENLAKNIKQLALVSNSAVNSFDGIVQGHNLSVDTMITGDEITKVGENSFNAGAFYDKNQGDGIYYGMYLRASNPRFEKVDKNASVLKVFHEIMSAGFVKIAVQKTESLTEASLREKINKGEVSVTEYDLFDASDKTNFAYPLYQLEQASVVVKKGLNPKTNFFTADNLYTIVGSVGQLGWIDKTIRDVWTYTEGNDWDRYYAIYNNQDGKKDNNVRVMKFYSTKTNAVWSCDNTFGIDPLYCSYDDKGNPVGGNSGGLFTGISNNFRTQVDYTISDNIYLNFGGENGGYDTEREGPVVFGASKDNGVIDSINQLNDTKRMNITIDASQHDVYVYINAPSKYTQPEDGKKGAYVKNSDGTYTMVGEGKGDYDVVAGIEFRKCSWRVKGEHNAYIMLVGDTSINANAYKLSVNTSGGIGSDTADRSDTMLGTHFYSGYYTTYSGSYMFNASEHNEDYSLKIAAKEISTVESGNMFIIGTMGNELTLGRGGYINGFVFLPNGRYVNNSVGFIGILPNAYSSNNQATIVAQDISIKGSNIGNLVFQAFDVAASAGGSSNDINIDFIETGDSITINKWEFGGYYYD
ncbi:MAG: hypothetical protein SOX04_04165 [Eubacteriales bacterium]|nr:hypothetical protein [Christensenellaceae bacterium]MDY3241725.1 hypothetical protein [Eubacteriales bacterium]